MNVKSHAFMTVALARRPARLVSAIILTAMALAGCAGPTVQLPSNVTLTHGSRDEAYIDRVDFSYRSPARHDFSKLKLCVAENVSNGSVSLRDSAGSFVGAASRTYYQANNVQAVQGDGVFKLVDDPSSTLIATGTVVSGESTAIVKDYVRFELKASTSGENVGLDFYAITRAQQNTGSLANDGFAPVGVWFGSRAPDIYASIQKVADKLKGCIN